MKVSEDLFKLIKSLSKNEKGYFKKVSTFHTIGEQNKYLALFNAIDKQKKYDENAIKKKFAGERFIKQLNVAKLYLYNSILKSTEQYVNSKGTQIRSYINQIEFLMDRGLYEQSNKLLHKAKQLAIKYEKNYELGLIEELEKRCLRFTGYAGKSEREILTLFGDTFQLIDKIKKTEQLHRLFVKMELNYKKGFPRTLNDWQPYEEIMNNPSMMEGEHIESYQASFYFYYIKANYYSVKKDAEKANYFTQERLKYLENRPHLINENVLSYGTALRNVGMTLVLMKRYSEVPPMVKKLKAITHKSEAVKKYICSFSMLVEMSLYTESGEFHKGKLLADQFIQNKTIAQGSNKDEIYLIYLSFTVYFGLGDYPKVIKCLNIILTNPNIDVRSGIYSFSKIFALIVYYEMQDEDAMAYAVKSTYRYLYEAKRLFMFESAILKFVKNKSKEMKDFENRVTAFKELRQEIEEIGKNEVEQRILKYFDFITWLDSKIENRPFAEMVREKASKVLSLPSS